MTEEQSTFSLVTEIITIILSLGFCIAFFITGELSFGIWAILLYVVGKK